MGNTKVMKITLFIILIFIGAFVYFEYFIMQKYFEQSIQKEQQTIKSAYNQKIQELQFVYTQRIRSILESKNIKKAIIDRDRKLVEKLLIEKLKILRRENKYIKTMLITDVNNVVYVRSHKPEMYGDDLTNVRPIIKAANEQKKILYGFEAGKMSIPYRVTVPIIYEEEHYGVLDMGISSNVFIDYINSISDNVEVTSLLNPKFLELFIKTTKLKNIPMKKGFLAPNFNKYFEDFFSHVDLDKESSILELNTHSYLINKSFKMESFNGTPFGIILAAYDISSEVKKQEENILFVILVITMFILSIFYTLKYGLKRYEKDLVEEKKSFEKLFQNSPDGILILENGHFIDSNRVIVDMLKYKSKEELLNVHPSELSPQKQPDGEDSFSKANKMMDIAREKGSHIFEWVHKKADGEDFWCEIALTPMLVFGKDIMHVRWRDITVIKDFERITQNKIEEKTAELKVQMKKAQQANKAKSEFLANMSHEIRTPLNAIMGFIDLLKDDELDPTREKYLKTVSKSSSNLLEIINDILDFSKIESNQLTLEYTDFCAKSEFESISELFKTKTSDKNIELIVEMSKNMPEYLNSDILRIKQVITNLISNAVKFSQEDKSIKLNISYKDRVLSASVKDEGIGIAEDKQESIFKAFTQADNSTTRKYGGTGLGLTISHKLIEALGGELKVKSQLDVGSEFYFSIPVKDVVSKVKEAVVVSNDVKFSGHVLLVEDNEANQMFMKVILKKLGLTFDISFDGINAVDRFPKLTCEDKVKYDVILMDENMPNMNGIEATKKILALEKELNLPHTPIIALTANALKGDRERFLDAGMDEYMTKPVNKKKLSTLLSKFLK